MLGLDAGGRRLKNGHYQFARFPAPSFAGIALLSLPLRLESSNLPSALH
jgi:hypothetical protein